MSDYLPVVGTLAGTILGAITGYAGQWAQGRRDDRRKIVEMRRGLYVAFLGVSHELFESTRRCYRDHPIDGDDRLALATALGQVSTTQCRRGLDEMRIVGDAEIISLAEALLHHLRHSGIVGGNVQRAAFRSWVDEYWDKRHALVDGIRGLLGVGTGNYVRQVAS